MVLNVSCRMGVLVSFCPPRTPQAAWPVLLLAVAPDAVAVPAQLLEALFGHVGGHRSVVNLTASTVAWMKADLAASGQASSRPGPSRRAPLKLLPGTFCSSCRQARVTLAFYDRTGGEDAAERQGDDKQRTEDAFQGALSGSCPERRSH
jgi:hypothetical protein